MESFPDDIALMAEDEDLETALKTRNNILKKICKIQIKHELK